MKTKQILLEYFKNDKLDVLDGGISSGQFNTNHYAAVSLEYLHKHLLKEKVTLKFVAKKVAELLKAGLLVPMPCTPTKSLVFCSKSYSKGRPFHRYAFIKNKVIIELYYNNSSYRKYVDDFNKLIN